jgi:hypothetical protein
LAGDRHARLYDELLRRLRGLTELTAAADALHDQDRLSSKRAELVYEGCFVTAVASFDAFLEDLFYAYLTGRALHTHVRPKVYVKSARTAFEVITSGERPAKWLPYSHTRTRARACLAQGKPFTRLDVNDTRILGELGTVRNAIAHRNRHATNQFRKLVQQGPHLPRELAPGFYLRYQPTSRVGETRMALYAAELARMARVVALQ